MKSVWLLKRPEILMKNYIYWETFLCLDSVLANTMLYSFSTTSEVQ